VSLLLFLTLHSTRKFSQLIAATLMRSKTCFSYFEAHAAIFNFQHMKQFFKQFFNFGIFSRALDTLEANQANYGEKNSYELHSFSHSSHTQEARNSFFGLGLNLLKSKLSIDDKL